MLINKFILLGAFLAISIFYHIFNIQIDSPNIYITISTFLFAIFVSYFINRRNIRYNKIREQITINDGHFSAIYRLFFYLSPKYQSKAGKIIRKHFIDIIEHHDWIYNIKRKTTTLTDLNNLAAEETKDKKLTTLPAQSLRQIQSSSANLQITRKRIWSLYHEKLTVLQ